MSEDHLTEEEKWAKRFFGKIDAKAFEQPGVVWDSEEADDRFFNNLARPIADQVEPVLQADPKKRAKAEEVMRKTGIPADVVETHQDEFERKVRAADIDRATINSPVARATMQDPQRAKLLHNQAETLVKVEKHLRDSAFMFGVDRAQELFGHGIDAIEDAIGLTTGFGQSIIKQQKEDMRKGRYKATYHGSLLDQESVVDMAGWLWEKSLENAATSIPALGGAALAVATAPFSVTAALGVTGASVALSGVLGTGEVAQEMKEMGVYNPYIALAGGSVVALLDRVGAGRVIPDAAVKQLVKTGMRQAVAEELVKEVTVTGVTKSLAKKAFAEGLTETLQEGVNVIAAASQGATYKTGDLLNRFVDAAALGSTMGATVGGTMDTASHTLNKTRQARRAEQRVAAMEALGETVQAEEAFETLPEPMQEFVTSVKEKHGTVESVSVNVQALEEFYEQAGMTPEQIERDFSNISQSIAEGKELGTEVEITLEEMTTHLAPQVHFENLVQDIRFGDEMTGREARVLFQDATDQAEAAAEAGVAPEGPLFESIRDQLEVAGRTIEEAEAGATLVARAFEQAIERGADPAVVKQRLDQLMITITREDMTPEQKAEALSALAAGREGQPSADADTLRTTLEGLGIDPTTATPEEIQTMIEGRTLEQEPDQARREMALQRLILENDIRSGAVVRGDPRVDPDEFEEVLAKIEGRTTELFQAEVPLTPAGGTIQPRTPAPTPEQTTEAKASTLQGAAAVNDRLPIIIPEGERVTEGVYTVGRPDTGERWSTLTPDELAARGKITGITKKVLDSLWQETLNRVSQAAKDAIARTGAKPVITPAEWKRALNLPLAAQLWYELSGEAFVDNLPGLPMDKFLVFVDVVGATSARSKPYDNLARSLAILSQVIQGVPVDVDVQAVAALRAALQRQGEDFSSLKGNKTGQFSGTMALTAGVSTEFPIPVNDVWVGRMFGITDDQLMSNQALHEAMAWFQILLSRKVNELNPDQQFPHQPWGVQSRGWVELRSSDAGIDTTKAQKVEGNDYSSEWARIIEAVKHIPGVSGDQITMQALQDPGFAEALRDTLEGFRKAPQATIELNSLLTENGKRATQLFDLAAANNDALTQREFLKSTIRAMQDVSTRPKGGVSLWTDLFRAISGEAVDVSRIVFPTVDDPFSIAGSFEGVLSPNIRVPMRGRKPGKKGQPAVDVFLTTTQIEMFNAIVGRAYSQAAMATSQTLYVDPTSALPAGKTRSFSVFIKTIEAIDAADIDAFGKALPEGFSISGWSAANGRVLDINPRFDEATGQMVAVTTAELDAALDATLGPKYTLGVFSTDYQSVAYQENLEYDQAVTAGHKEINDGFREELTELGVEEDLVETIIFDPIEADLKQIPFRIRGRAQTIAKRLAKRRDDLAAAEARAIEGAERLDTDLATNIPKWENRLNKAGVEVPLTPVQIEETVSRVLGQEGPGAPRGAIAFDEALNFFAITLKGGADRSTFLHESGHFFLEMMGLVVATGAASDQQVADYETIRAHLGIQLGEATTTPQHEEFARLWEAYVFEGSAPSRELRDVFRQFSIWLKSIYKTLAGLNVELSPEIREVFDRMLASDEAIAEAKDLTHFMPAFESQELSGLDDKAWAKFVENYGDALLASNEELDNRILQEVAREKSRELREIRKSEREAAEASVDNLPVSQVRAFIKTGETKGDIRAPEDLGGHFLSSDALTSIDPALLKRLTGFHRKEGGLHPDVIAPHFGYTSGEEMIKDMMTSQNRKDAIDGLVKARMEAIVGDMRTDGSLMPAAVTALHSNAQAEFMLTELNALTRRANSLSVKSMNKILQTAAAARIEELPVTQLKPERYRIAEARESKAAALAVIEEDFQEAAAAKQRQMMNHFLYREASKAREEAGKIRTFLARFNKTETRSRLGKADEEYLDAVDALLEGVNLRQVSLRKIDKRINLNAWIKEEIARGMPIVVSESFQNELDLKNWKEMTLGELTQLRDAVKSIDHVARNRTRLIAQQRDEETTSVIGKMRERSDEVEPTLAGSEWVNPTKMEKWTHRQRWVRASMIKPEFILKWLDGEVAGLAHDYMFQGIVDAQHAEQDWRRKMEKAVLNPLHTLPASQRARFATKIEFLGAKMRFHEMIAIALNMGNEQNIQRLIGGYEERYGWTTESVFAELDKRMQKADWDLVQTIWDGIDQMRKPLFDAKQRASGIRPAAVEPLAFQTRHGVYKGGYYPIVFDKNQSYRAELVDQKKTSEALWENNYFRPEATASASEARIKGDVSIPLKLSLDVVGQHVLETVHFFTHWEAVDNANKLIQHPDFRKLVTDKLGKEQYMTLRPWLQAIANDAVSIPETSMIDSTMRHVRDGTSVVAMGLSLSTSMMQFFGISTSLDAIPFKYWLSGLKKSYGAWNPSEVAANWAFAEEKSGEIRHITKVFDREVRRISDQSFGKLSKVAGIRQAFFLPMAYAQKTVNVATWHGAYEHALDDVSNGGLGKSEKEAANYAESIVRMTQAGGGMKDMTALQRGGPTQQIFTMFMTFFNVLYNRLEDVVRQQRTIRDVPKTTARLAVLVVIPAMLEGLMRDQEPDDRDRDDPWSWIQFAATKSLLYGMASVPIARDVASGALGEYGYSLSPVGNSLNNMVRAAGGFERYFERGQMTNSQWRAAVNATGMLTKLPSNQLWKLYEFIDAASRREFRRDNAAEIALQAVFGLSEDKRKRIRRQ